ncbi:MAG: [Fe-S]-binding protein, partial [Bacteroidia bacterium]|nr:[Fe-S]-binding protein [Bacteroidia bacterium]
FLSKHPGSKHVQYDAVSYSGMLLANEASGFGRKIPSYNFSAAKVIVSLGADFLGTWLSPVEFARGYSKGRKIDEKNPQMSKHYQFESFLSMTGANADERFTHRPSETGAVALALLSALTGTVSVPGITDANLKKGIEKVAADLKTNSEKALVISSSNDVNVQVIVNAINSAIGAYGTTIDWNIPVNYRQGIDKDMHDLVDQMDAGQVGALLIHSANPAYNYYDADKFKSALKKVKLAISFTGKMDETTELCNFSIPDHHYLESWGDAEPKAGYTSFLQPAIFPLFKTRPFQTSLLRWCVHNVDYEEYFKNYWTGKLGSPEAFDKALQDGVIEPTTIVAPGSGTYSSNAVASASSAIGMASAQKRSDNELALYQKVSIGSGAQSGNPWLQEFPDPVSKATWDNYALISVTKAKELGIKLDSDYEYYPEKPVVKLTIGKNEVELPVLVIPGMNADTIAVALGYGRSEAMGKTASGVGKNAFLYTSYNGTTVDYHVTGVSITNLNKKYKLAQTQKHNSYEGRIEVVRETTLATFKKEPDTIPEYREELKEEYYNSSEGNFLNATLYPQHEQPGIKWGMSIDMNSCVACGACV